MTTTIPIPATFTAGHALVIGVGTYDKASNMNVPMTAEDARQVAALLIEPRYCAYPQEQVTLLTDTAATRQNILDALDQLAKTVGEDATILLFYSGHGLFSDENYYLTTYDTELVDGKMVSDTGVRERELLDRLNAIKAQRAVLIFNACHSGAIAPAALGKPEPASLGPTGTTLPDQLTTALLATGEGRVVITACKEQQSSYFVRDAETTLFAQALLDTLQGRGVDSRHGFISVFDLYAYVYSSVNGEVKRRWGLAQDPVLTIHQGVGVMAVAAYRGKEPQGSLGPQDRPEHLGGAAREVDPKESAETLKQILNGTVNLAAGRDITGNTIIGGNQNNVGRDQNTITGDQYTAQGDMHVGDTIDAQGSQGFVNQPSGPLTQNYGGQRTINTGGGDFAERDIDKRQGAFVSGGTVYGPVTGTNSGEIRTDYRIGGEQSTQQSNSVTLRDLRRAVRQAIDAASTRGDRNLASDLDDVEQNLSAAIGAESSQDNDQRARKLRQVKSDLTDLVTSKPEVQELVTLAQQVS